MLDQLNEAADIAKQRAFSDLEKQGLIQGFEYTYELAWKTLKDFLEYRGQTEILGSKDAFRKAFSLGVLEEGEVWMDMIKSRNRTAHTYNKQTAEEIVTAILDDYAIAFNELEKFLAGQ